MKVSSNFGSTLLLSTNIDVEISNGNSKASSAFERLRKTAWDRRGIHLATILKVYGAVVLTTFLYGCETWTAYRRHKKQLTTHTSDVSGHFSTYAGRTKSPNLKFCRKLTCPASLPSFARPKSDGHVMSLACPMIAS